MIRYILSDFSYVLLFPKNKYYKDELNKLYNNNKYEKNFTYLDDFEFNMELFNFYNSIRGEIKVVIFTSGIVQEDPEAKNITSKYVDSVISATKYGMKKSNPDIYRLLLRDLKVDSREVIFIDDSVTNLEAAYTLGIKCVQYVNNYQAISTINRLLTENI